MSGLFAEPVLAGPAPKGLGRAMGGGAGMVARRGNDFYPTPRAVTAALVTAERDAMARALLPGERVWEPCGRGGAMAAVLNAHGFATVATDIVADPAHDVAAADLLTVTDPPSRVVVTNPPFALAEPMIRHLLKPRATGGCGAVYLALLLKAQFWHAATRTGLFAMFTPARVWALNWRPDFLDQGAPTMDVVWTVWDGRVPRGGTLFDVLSPVSGSDDLFVSVSGVTVPVRATPQAGSAA